MSKSGEPTVRGPWSVANAYEFLEHAVIPMRIGVESSSGCPLVLSVWFIADGYELLGATQSSSVLARSLERSARCGFEVAADAPPYRGVRGQAQVELKPEEGAGILDRLLVRYLGSTTNPLGARLRARSADEVGIRLRPVSLVSWDYTDRMTSSLVLPSDG